MKKSKNKLKSAALHSLLILTSIFHIEPVLADLYKCKDKNDNVIYSDKPCIHKTPQKLDINISPIDKASAERLKYLQPDDSSTPRNKKQVTIIKTQKRNPQCETYINKIKQMKKQLNSGHSNKQGQSIQKSMDQQSELYRQNCN